MLIHLGKQKSVCLPRRGYEGYAETNKEQDFQGGHLPLVKLNAILDLVPIHFLITYTMMTDDKKMLIA